MVSSFDHVTIAVRAIEPAIRFFALLGFELSQVK
jgi:catechol 2,3-dioxygenase-like lactoylglutathione lyase family enzyme